MRKNIDRYSRIKPSISFYSYKNASFQFCESQNEARVCLALEFDDSVVAYRTQPASYSYELHGQTRRYTPDLLILDPEESYRYEEIKSPKSANDPKFRKKFAYLVRLFQYTIQVPLILRIGAPAGFPAMHRLYRYLHYTPKAACLELLSKQSGPWPLGEAVSLAIAEGFRRADVFTLMAHKHVLFDWNKKITDSTTLEVLYG